MDPEIISGAISRAIAESVDQGVKGKDITPFLLDRIQQMTGGDSLDSNIQLVYNNARLGAEIAVELARLAQPIATRGVAA
jgi:pseudouridine-5'-phosphate glycosidase